MRAYLYIVTRDEYGWGCGRAFSDPSAVSDYGRVSGDGHGGKDDCSMIYTREW